MAMGLLFTGAIMVFLMAGLHVATAIFFTAYLADWLDMGVLPSMIGNLTWNTMNEFLLVAIPLFILLGELLSRSGVAELMYKGLSVWLRWLPGGLLHTNIVASALFAATSGSTVATAATIGTVAQPTMAKLGYNERMVLGSIAAGGTLGILIPPSINMIVYGALTNVSVGKLFIAGVIPGLALAITMSAIIVVVSLIWGDSHREEGPLPSLAKRLRMLLDLLPVLFVFALVMGSIYAGLATPTEAAAVGIVGALIIAASNRTLTVAMLHESFLSSVRTTAMVMLVLTTAFVLNFSLSLTGLPQQLSEYIRDLNWSATTTIWMLVLFYLLLGIFIEAMAMMVTTVGIVTPLVVSLGFDPVWFGIFITVMMELAIISPPVGLNLYVVQNLRPVKGSINDVFIGVLPFVVAMLIFVALLIEFPGIALWLPNQVFK
ncbi:TRAP transporter large permease subunit [Azorhizobium sp. AG788]|uniref:TRAP transporter large permease n=1 Tax=Azorhizobium sp. AG788 TaxID=2183897 RepID=UPI0031391442